MDAPAFEAGSGLSPFPPIADYAFLSDCETAALVAPSGNVEWLCAPRIDSPSIFGAMLDRGAGGFRLGPAGAHVPTARRYLPGTNVLETSWGVGGGWIIVRDALLIGPWHDTWSDALEYRRAPTDYQAEHILVRTVRCVNGEVQLSLECEPALDYGRQRVRWRYGPAGFGEALAYGSDQSPVLTLRSDLRLGFEGPRALARSLIKEGETRFCALSWGTHEPPVTYADAYSRLVWTAHHWQHWLARGRFPDHRWRSYLERSALTLKGLMYAPSGAIAAAPTTSLPETRGGNRNWDYRFSWIRDSSLTLWAMYTLGFDWEANDYFHFLAELAERDSDLQIVYGLNGETDLTERTLDHLSGYESSRPVRTGNGAFAQQQNDVWGALIESMYLHATSRDVLDERWWPILERQVEAALTHWREPDQGIWEIRGEPQHFVSSKLMCWVAADRGARLARLREAWAHARRWQAAADEIHADICAHGVDSRGVFVQHYNTTALDASVLLMVLLRFLPSTDERVRATVLAIADELTEEGLVLRYRTEQIDDGLGSQEGSFTMCSFWLVSALSEIGEDRRARDLCERLLVLAGPLGLFAEEVEPGTGQHLGNYPQALTHLALINAVLHVIESEERVRAALRPSPERLVF